MPFDFARLEASRLARGGRDGTAPVTFPRDARYAPKPRTFLRTDFAVGRLYDDGRFIPTQCGMLRDVAESVAGRKRDESTDTEVAQQLLEHWTWAFRPLRGNPAKGVARVPYVPRGRVASMGRGFAAMTPERRAEVSAAGNKARLKSLSPKRQSEIASMGGKARWAK